MLVRHGNRISNIKFLKQCKTANNVDLNILQCSPGGSSLPPSSSMNLRFRPSGEGCFYGLQTSLGQLCTIQYVFQKSRARMGTQNRKSLKVVTCIYRPRLHEHLTCLNGVFKVFGFSDIFLAVSGQFSVRDCISLINLKLVECIKYKYIK